jgi:hypothetical protein
MPVIATSPERRCREESGKSSFTEEGALIPLMGRFIAKYANI